VAKSLILHDETDCRELIKRVLLENGHEVATFTEEEEALAWTSTNQVDLAIVSLEPGIVQSKICQGLKKLSENLKILVLTTYTNRGLATEALKQGADDYLLKPIEIKKLEAKVRSIITGKIPTR
jgi:DNA-binding response OmpR family regulator